MINLLPSDIKQDYAYGRRNTALRRWLVAFVGGLLGVLVIGATGMLYLQESINHYQTQIARSEATLQHDKLTEVQQQSSDITGSLKLVVKVLSKEILFSKLLKQIGTVTPSNSALTDLTIAKTQGAIDITAIAADYTSATQLQVNLQAPGNQIFSKADIQSIACSTNASDPKYPCTVTIRALFSQNNPYLFINEGNK